MTHPGEHLADETLSILLDDRLTSEESRAARAHLETCTECQARLDQLESVVQLLRALPSLETPRTFALGPRLVSDPPNVIRLRRWYTITRAGAASLAAVFVFLSVGALYAGWQPTPSSVSSDAKAQPASAPAPLHVRSAPSSSEEAVPAPAATSAPAQKSAGAAAPAPALAGAARSSQSAPTPAGDGADLTTAATSVRPLPTPVPTAAVRAVQPAPSASSPASDQLDPVGPLRIAAALVGVMAALGVLAALIVRHRLQAASRPRITE